LDIIVVAYGRKIFNNQHVTICFILLAGMAQNEHGNLGVKEIQPGNDGNWIGMEREIFSKIRKTSSVLTGRISGTGYFLL
jgi:hypothetical protein